MEKAVSTIEEWLQDCDSSTEADHLNSCVQNDQDRLIHAIFLLFEEKTRYPELFENTVKQLFVLARNKDKKLRDFVLLFVPSFIFIYLSAVSIGDKKSVSSVEITLVSLYNTEVLSDGGVVNIASFRLPTLARHSIFHEPTTLAPASYTSDSLQRLEAGDAETVRWGPPKHITTVTAATRYHLATALLVAFNARLSKYPKVVLSHLCKATSKLVCQGFSRPGHHHRSSYGSESSFGVYPRPVPRIPVTSDMLAELVHAVYFAMFNGLTSLGLQALEDVHMRSQYELFADVLLMTNGIKNSLKINPTGQPSEAPMGINIALPPSTNSASLSKSCITNASFRTKKLPDDIPIQKEEERHGLASISEDQDGEEKDIGRPIKTQGSGRDKEGKERTKLTSNLPLTGLVKKRDKEKYKNGDKRDNERKSDKERKSKQDKEKDKDRENRNETFLNRNSSTLSVDLSISSNTSDGVLKQTSPQQQQLIEMKPIGKGNVVLDVTKLPNDGRIEEQPDGLPQGKAADMNGAQNQVGKVS